MRNISPDMLAEYTSGSVSPAVMIEMFFDSGTLRMWTGYGTVDFNGETFFGAGNMIGFSTIEETEELEAKGIVVSLNGIPSSLIAISLTEKTRARPFRMYLASYTTQRYVATEDGTGVVDLEDDSGSVLLENQLIDVPYKIFSGLMDVIEFVDNGQEATLRLSVENALIIGRRTKVRRYTSEDQKKRFPNDKGLDFINQLQDKELVW